MSTFSTGTRSALGRAVSAEVRARMGARRMTLRDFAREVGFQSHNYVAIRNRDEKSYDLDDIELICDYYMEEPRDFIAKAMAAHSDDVYAEADRMERDTASALEPTSPRARARMERDEAAGRVLVESEHPETKRPRRPRRSKARDAETG